MPIIRANNDSLLRLAFALFGDMTIEVNQFGLDVGMPRAVIMSKSCNFSLTLPYPRRVTPNRQTT